MPKVTFEFNAKKEYDFINFFEKNLYKLNLPKNLRSNWKNKKEAIKLIEAVYKKERKKEYENNWKPIEKDYFDLVEKITNHKWLHKNYRVVITKYMLGFANPFDINTNKVTCRQNYKKIERNYIIAHELFHLHYHKIISKKNNPALFNSELNENCVILTLCFSEIKNLLVEPKNEWIIKEWINSHPDAAKYFKKLLPLWKNRKNFDDYLKKSLSVLKK